MNISEYDAPCSAPKIENSSLIPGEVLDNLFLSDVFREVSDPQMASFSHHPVYE